MTLAHFAFFEICQQQSEGRKGTKAPRGRLKSRARRDRGRRTPVAAASARLTALDAPGVGAVDRHRKRKRRVAASIDRPSGFNIDAIDLTIDEEGDGNDDDDDGGATESEASQDTINLTTPQVSARPFAIMNSYCQRNVRPKPLEMPEKSPAQDDAGWKSASSSDAKSSGLRYSTNVNGSTPTHSGRMSKLRQQRLSHGSPPLIHPTGPNRTIAKLRQLVRSCIKRHQVAAALFYADKLPLLSKLTCCFFARFVGGGRDICDTCYLNHEYHRAIHAIKKMDLVQIDNVHAIRSSTLKALLLLGQCMLAIKQREECLDLIGKVLPENENAIIAFARRFDRDSEDPDDVVSINIVSALALLMGETFEAVGNRDNAALYFRIALRCDVYNSEAFFHLFDKQMLSSDEEKKLVASLNFSTDELGLLRLLYQSHIGKYDANPTISEKFNDIEEKCGMKGNLDLNIVKAETYYYQHDIQKANEICEWVRDEDPFNSRVIAVYVATLVELGKKRELYHYAHQMVDVYPKKASAWYTVGCYYLLVKKYEAAQRYFHKATTLEPTYAPAWIGFGNSFAAQDESDQAMSSYRTASSLFPGSHLPPLFIGMEHLRTNNLPQAIEFIKQASAICPTDPLVYNELGTAYYKQKNYPMAIEMFTKALQLCKHLPEASILAALGFTYHMKGNLEEAIESYHAALAYNPEDTLAGEMITVAFEESLSSSHSSLSSFTVPTPERRTPMGLHSSILGRPTDTSQGEDTVRRTLQLDNSFSSIEPSHRLLVYSSLDFSDDSSMNLDE
ncbi:Cell division cycle protein 16, partial [Globisporangium splendens]